MRAGRLRLAPLEPWFRRVVQAGIIVMLLVAGWTFNERINSTESQTAAVNGVLARSCGAASFAELREQGLVEECRLAQQGALVDAIPDSALPSPGAQPSDVEADIVKDDSTSTPADVRPIAKPTGPTNAQVESAVSGYFTSNPIATAPGYQRAIQRAVGAYLTANPPPSGRPPTEREIAKAVRAALLANPPADGEGGRGVAAAALDGCDVVFTYSDGETVRIGPLCGKTGSPGPAPTGSQIAQAVAAYCTANGECRGPVGPAGKDGKNGEPGTPGTPGTPGVVETLDNCQPPPDEMVIDVDISGPIGDPLTITLSCTTAPRTLPVG